MKISGGSPVTGSIPEFKGKDGYQFFNILIDSRNYGFHVAKDSATGEIEVYFAPRVILSKNKSGIDVVLKEGK